MLQNALDRKTRLAASVMSKYAALLHKQATDPKHWTPGDETALIDLIDSAGISRERVIADANAVETVARCERLLTTWADAEKRSDVAKERFRLACAERQRIIAQLNEAVCLANNELGVTGNELARIEEAQREMHRLKASNPLLFPTNQQ
jgi:hypothetical protein